MTTTADNGRYCIKYLLLYWRQLVVIITPIALLPLVLLEDSNEKSRCAYALLVIAIFWSTQAVPLAITSLLPAVLFPLLGTMSTSAVAAEYTKNTVLMNFGSITIATSFEKCNLHRRVALGTMSLIGTEPRWIMLSFMLPTWFLSMWISNTSTTALMLPLLESVLHELEKFEMKVSHSPSTECSVDEVHLETVSENASDGGEALKENHGVENKDSASNYRNRFAKAMVLCIAYSANIGGISTVTGTGTNLIMQEISEELWKEVDLTSPVSFSSWMVFGLPLSVLTFIMLFIVLQIMFIGFRQSKNKHNRETGSSEKTKKIIRVELDKLGNFTFAEGSVSILFVAMVLLWFFRKPSFMNGWATYFEAGYAGGSVSALTIALLLYVIPFNAPWKSQSVKDGRLDTLMDWEYFNRKMPWQVLLILGGGFALARGVIGSGLGDWLGGVLASGPALPGWVLVLCLSLLASGLTEFVSNSATCSLLMPIVASMAKKLGKNPLYFMFPVAISTSFSFMLPVGTPPNTLAYATGRVENKDMMKTGIVLNILCAFGVTLATHTWGYYFFDLGSSPWLEDSMNATLTSTVSTLENI